MRPLAAAIAGIALLAGCATRDPAALPAHPPVASPPTQPVARSFGAPHAQPPSRSNTEIARDFLDLNFRLESGQSLPVFTRYERPITIAVTGIASPALDAELNRLIGRLQTEARLNVRRVSDPAGAAVVVEGVTRKQLAQVVPQAACFVLPTRVTWDQFRQTPRSMDYAWTRLTERTAATAFVPVDTSRQEIRDCLHEEVAQSLGPLNDLYRLEDSVFNDDNLNSILTGFDMLLLRATYSPSLHSGMTENEVAALLPGILAGLNPSGNTQPSRAYRPDEPRWTADITRALSSGSVGSRRNAAETALSEAEAAGWQDNRTALSLYTLGRLEVGEDDEAALEHFLRAGDIYKRLPATRIHAAHVGFQVAAFALGAQQWDVVEQITTRYVPVATEFEDASLLSDLLIARSAALKAEGKPWEATRQEGLDWGLFAHGTATEAARRAAEIEALAARQAS